MTILDFMSNIIAYYIAHTIVVVIICIIVAIILWVYGTLIERR